MDWENKFASILREADSNLSKTRRKINFTRYNDRNFSVSLPMRRTSSLLEFPRTDFNSSVYNPCTTEPTGTSSGLVQALSDRLEEQNRLIDQLRQMVNRLETDRSNYNEQIRELKNEVYKMSGSESPKIDRKLNKVRHDLNGDIQLLNSEIQMLRNTGSNKMSDNQFYSLSKDVQEVKQSLKDDIGTIKRDIDTVKSRLFKMELDVASAFNNGKDLQRKQDLLDRNVHDLAKQQHKQEYRPLQGSWSPTSDNDRLNISELRSTVSLLRDRLGNMEAVVNSRPTTPRYSTPVPNGYSSSLKYQSTSPKKQKPIYKASIKLDNDVDSDDFLVSDDDSDLEIFNPKKQDIKGLDSDDDDLDLDDLDLDDEMGSLDSELNDL
ncbi:major antigen-like isoform X1 [Mytilus edulis]|uniref:major antigen-like isoform X1 n=1 Tax=Mytilus edulis TaxID=6550 RepID=UPI0039F0CCF2